MKKSREYTEQVIFLLTQAEKQRLYEAAQAEDRTLTALIRRALAPIIMPAEENNSPPYEKPESPHTLAS